jgi:hypothetical protein
MHQLRLLGLPLVLITLATTATAVEAQDATMTRAQVLAELHSAQSAGLVPHGDLDITARNAGPDDSPARTAVGTVTWAQVKTELSRVVETGAIKAGDDGRTLADGASAQSFADSTGGSSQIHGELVTTPSGIVPEASPPAPTRVSQDAGPAVASRFQAYADSTGGSSAARARDLLDHAQIQTASADRFAARARFQPYLDSTGGSSMASAERVFEEAGDAGPARGVGVAATQPADPAVR